MQEGRADRRNQHSQPDEAQVAKQIADELPQRQSFTVQKQRRSDNTPIKVLAWCAHRHSRKRTDHKRNSHDQKVANELDRAAIPEQRWLRVYETVASEQRQGPSGGNKEIVNGFLWMLDR
ncbi:MAG: hypothetical protein K2X72_03070 [Reyranella sp.]|nr:hypothetical protein [Reyranella sp.]